MDTSEYTTKKERKQAKKLTRHPLFQKMRKRAIEAEASGPELLKKLASATSKLDAANKEIKRLSDEVSSLEEPKKEAEPAVEESEGG